MRKEYFKPVMMTMDLMTVNLLAASAPRWERRELDRGNTTESYADGGQWGNIWNR